MRESGVRATTSMAAGTHLWADSTNRFGGGSSSSTAAVATAVVSKPVAKNTTGSLVARAMLAAWVAA
ncbi:MAG: hypothetical protein U1F43_11345 [Myxococcota bacterium]